MIRHQRGVSAILALGWILALPASSRAQSALPAQGEGTVGVIYSHLFVQDHIFAEGDHRDVGHIRSHVILADIEYGLTDRWAVRAHLPYVTAKYSGGFPHRHVHGPQPPGFVMLDDQTYHSALQDFGAEVRYGAMEFPVAIAPFIGVNIPTHDYEVFAHSAIGLNMVELQVGVHAGIARGPFSLEGRIAYGVHEKVLGVRRNRTALDAEIGWFATPSVRLFAFQASQISHGGFDIVFADLPATQFEEWWPHHDQLGRANHLNVGGGTSVRVSHSMTLHGSVYRTATGINTHAAKYGLSMGASWGFGGPRPVHPSASVARHGANAF